MPNSISWLHLSDFHFGKNEYEQKFSAGKLIEHIKEQKKNGIQPNYVFITGDVANSGKKEEYELYYSTIVEPLLDIFGSGFIENIFVVPGNHDLDRSVNDAFSKEKLIKPDSAYFLPEEKSFLARKMVVDRFQCFVDNSYCLPTLEFSKANGYFTQKVSIGKKTISIIGINTAWLCEGDKDMGNLTPGLQLTRSALTEAKDSDIKIVLGHHPFDWFHISHQPALRSIFAEHRVIYLHGHMHRENGTTTVNGAGEFLSIQAGAAWQAPEGSKWVNGFMWAKMNFDSDKIHLQPYSWSFNNQHWHLNGANLHDKLRLQDWWIFDSPSGKKKIDYTSKIKQEPLVGWEIKDLKTLDQNTGKLDDQDAISYFDGATPNWRIALSDSIPRRDIVAKISGVFLQDSDAPTVCTLIAAGCEGKTTALLQSCLEILKKDKARRVLFRTNHTRSFDPNELRSTLRLQKKWLIVIDEADQVANEVLRFIDSGCDGFDGQIDFLLASRDSDWRSSGANDLAWDFRARYKEIVLKDLGAHDAELIVNAWAQFGARGLGEMAQLNAAERPTKLRYYARKEAQGSSGAFFGALLLSRHGGDLLEHADSMLQKLSKFELECGKSLKDVLGYIAAMHAEGFEKLTFITLAALLQMPVSKLQQEVIRQLGREAAATSTSSAIFTRHRYIAEAIVEVLHGKFNEDVSQYFIDLAISESERAKTEHVMNLQFWRFEMAERLFNNGKQGLAIEIARRLYESDTSNVRLLTRLASFYRKNDNAAEAVSLFRSSPDYPKQRGFYFEWGMCESVERKYLESALLAFYALTDECESTSPTIEQACMYLSGLSACADQLHIVFADPIFREGEAAANSLLASLYKIPGTSFRKGDSRIGTFLRDVERNRRKAYRRTEAQEVIKEMIRSLKQYGYSTNIDAAIGDQNFTLDYLDKIVVNAEKITH